MNKLDPFCLMVFEGNAGENQAVKIEKKDPKASQLSFSEQKLPNEFFSIIKTSHPTHLHDIFQLSFIHKIHKLLKINK